MRIPEQKLPDCTTNEGYAIIEGALSADCCDNVGDALRKKQRGRYHAGARHLLSVPEVSEIAGSAALIDIASQFLGTPAIPFKATLFEKSGRANWLVAWHQDTALPV